MACNWKCGISFCPTACIMNTYTLQTRPRKEDSLDWSSKTSLYKCHKTDESFSVTRNINISEKPNPDIWAHRSIRYEEVQGSNNLLLPKHSVGRKKRMGVGTNWGKERTGLQTQNNPVLSIIKAKDRCHWPRYAWTCWQKNLDMAVKAAMGRIFQYFYSFSEGKICPCKHWSLRSRKSNKW